MSGKTKIEWADRVWNPVTGCTPVSEGCRHCYAARMATRLAGRCGYPKENPFKVTVHPERLEVPLRWGKPTMVFVNSMGDMFHEDVPFDFIDEVVKIISRAPIHLLFLILTKRPAIMLKYFHSRGNLANNVWLGVTAENQQTADERIPLLLQTPAAVRFVSVEPMLGPVDLTRIKWAKIPVDPKNYERLGVPAPDEMWSLNNTLLSRPGDEWNKPKVGIDWVICGGETGPGARPMHPDWVRSLRDQCEASGVPFFFKGWGEWDSNHNKSGKKKSGRLLDGVEWWIQLPEQNPHTPPSGRGANKE